MHFLPPFAELRVSASKTLLNNAVRNQHDLKEERERHQYIYLPAHPSYVAALLVVARQYLALSTTYIRVFNFTFVLKTAVKYLKTVTVLVYRFQIYTSEYINPNNKKTGKTCLITFVASTSRLQ